MSHLVLKILQHFYNSEVRSILKPPPSTKKGGILKKSGSAGNIKEVRDSLEITRVHLQTSAEEKEQRVSVQGDNSTWPHVTDSARL